MSLKASSTHTTADQVAWRELCGIDRGIARLKQGSTIMPAKDIPRELVLLRKRRAALAQMLDGFPCRLTLEQLGWRLIQGGRR